MKITRQRCRVPGSTDSSTHEKKAVARRYRLSSFKERYFLAFARPRVAFFFGAARRVAFFFGAAFRFGAAFAFDFALRAGAFALAFAFDDAFATFFTAFLTAFATLDAAFFTAAPAFATVAAGPDIDLVSCSA